MAEMSPEAALAALEAISRLSDARRRAPEEVAALRTHLQQLQARCEALQADAERYRMLSDLMCSDVGPTQRMAEAMLAGDGKALDAALDRIIEAANQRAAIDSARKEREQ